jgi:hypothetical protein
MTGAPFPSAEALDICERFIGQVVICRDIVEQVEQTSTWQRLRHGPVTAIGQIGDRKPGEYEVDIDSAGDGWMRIIEPSSEPVTVRYNAGMAETFASVPAPLAEGMRRLDRHLATAPDQEPPAVVTALWRPYRRLRRP